MARLRSLDEEGKGGILPCNLLGGVVGQHPGLVHTDAIIHCPVNLSQKLLRIRDYEIYLMQETDFLVFIYRLFMDCNKQIHLKWSHTDYESFLKFDKKNFRNKKTPKHYSLERTYLQYERFRVECQGHEKLHPLRVLEIL